MMHEIPTYVLLSNLKVSKYILEGGGKKSRQAQNLANSKKSTILLQSL